jgi:site-specific DNA-adenine methylase
MFSYYGSKSKIVDYYPPPKYGKIIEPFAGSARYSLKYWDRDVLLVDKYEVIVSIWQWLQKCSPKDILGLPKIKKGDRVSQYNLSKEESLFLGFCVVSAAARPQDKPATFEGIPLNRNCLENTAKNLHKIKHWKIAKGSYEDLENTEATWFIDPPYQFGGEHYKHGIKELNFINLAQWCKIRNGQVIVCENTKATWMDFKPMISMDGSLYKTTEAIWSNIPTNYDSVQTKLFL